MIKIGIIGSGFGLYGLLPSFNETPECKVTAICGRKTERLLNYCESIGLKKIYTDWKEMFEKESLDAVAIAVPPNDQYEIAKVAIEKGLHIFAEKPLAATHAQAKELYDLSLKYKIVNAVDFIFPEIDEWVMVKKLLDSKTVGELKHIAVRWDFLSFDIKNKKVSWKTDISHGGGALSFYFSHVLYYLEYFGGKITQLKSTLFYSEDSPSGGDVGLELFIKFDTGITAEAYLNSNNPDLNKHQLTFTCKEGAINLENKNSTTSDFVINISGSGGMKKISRSSKMDNKTEDERVRVLKKSAERFINSIEQSKHYFPSFKEGLRVQELIEKIRINDSKGLIDV